MADAVETTHVALTLGEDNDEAFQQDAEKVGEEFLRLYFKDSKSLVRKGITRSKESKADASPEDQIAFEYVPDDHSAFGKPAYRDVAEMLQMIGDQLDDTYVQRAISKLSVFDVGRGELVELCRQVLASSYNTMKSGWQQVHAVYYCLARVVQELRQYNLSETVLRQREALLMRFLGPVLQELGLGAWIAGHGGLRQVPSEADTRVPILGSSV